MHHQWNQSLNPCWAALRTMFSTVCVHSDAELPAAGSVVENVEPAQQICRGSFLFEIKGLAAVRAACAQFCPQNMCRIGAARAWVCTAKRLPKISPA
jgi:hypothetical protein